MLGLINLFVYVHWFLWHFEGARLRFRQIHDNHKRRNGIIYQNYRKKKLINHMHQVLNETCNEF